MPARLAVSMIRSSIKSADPCPSQSFLITSSPNFQILVPYFVASRSFVCKTTLDGVMIGMIVLRLSSRTSRSLGHGRDQSRFKNAPVRGDLYVCDQG
jgi:hypothetical protein